MIIMSIPHTPVYHQHNEQKHHNNDGEDIDLFENKKRDLEVLFSSTYLSSTQQYIEV